jgi:hypothetical protein
MYAVTVKQEGGEIVFRAGMVAQKHLFLGYFSRWF